MHYFRCFLLVMGLLLPWQNHAIEGALPVKAELIQEEQTIQPGRSFWVALRFIIEDKWHVYWKNPGDAGLPLSVEWELPSGLKAGPLNWPFPEKFTFEDMVGFGYEKEVVLLTEMTPDHTLQPGSPIELNGRVNWLVCSDLTCQPGSVSVRLNLQVESTSPPLNEKVTRLFKETRAKLPASHVIVKTIRKEGIVQIQVPAAEAVQDQDSLVNIEFFPEQQDMIDHSVDPTVSLNQATSDKYVVNLKGSDQVGVKTANLKGVLVVRTKKEANQQIQAFAVDSPIQENEGEDFLSFVELPRLPHSNFVIGNMDKEVTSSSSFEGGLPLALIFAFIGGMILNLMPCVLPVMSFKILSFVKMARQSRTLTLKHGMMFTLGVLISFWLLAGAMLALRGYGQAVGWGFQLQEPLFVVILASLLFIFSLSLFGVFELGLSVSSWAGQTEVQAGSQSEGYTSSFLSGVLATAVATPCTGPFLGSAVGFAFTLPIFQALLIFTSLALGMCFPYLVLAAFPSFLRFMPKPGPWMETFKHLMGFGLLATVLWLMWVFSAQTNTLSLICLLAGFLCFSVGAWIYGKGSMPLVSKSKRLIAYAFVVVMAIAGIQAIILPRQSWYQEEFVKGEKQGSHQQDDWETFSPERVAELQQQGIPVLIDFTAKWCLICQANHLALSTEDVTSRLAELGVVKMKADWTKNDPVITKELSKFGRSSVPLYVLYGTEEGKEPTILPQVLTPDVIISHIESTIDSEQIALK